MDQVSDPASEEEELLPMCWDCPTPGPRERKLLDWQRKVCGQKMEKRCIQNTNNGIKTYALMWGIKHKSHNCERCGNDFFSRSALRYHFHAKHLGRTHCDTCGRKLSRVAPRRHVEIYSEKILSGNKENCCNIERETKFVATVTSVSCRMCSKQFGTVHAREHHEKQEHRFTAGKRAQMSMGFKSESILECKTPLEVETFLEAKLRPSSALRIACASEIEGMIALIKEVFPLPVAHVSKGGSYIKGTDSQDRSDVDIVLFSDAFKSLEDCKRRIQEILKDLMKNLLMSSWNNRLIFGERTPFSLRLYFKCFQAHHGHSFDIMPCYDTLGPTSSTGLKKSFYHELYFCNDSDKIQLYSMALLKYQVAFVKASTERVKDLMRLVKHWFKTSFAKSTEENRFRRFPSSYSMELLTIYVWELAGKPTFFSFVQGLRAVLKLLVRYQEICIVWHKYYKPTLTVFQKVISKQTKPVVLDPANPTFNVCENSNAWDEVAHVARQSLLKPLFNGVQAKEPWLFTNNW